MRGRSVRKSGLCEGDVEPRDISYKPNQTKKGPDKADSGMARAVKKTLRHREEARKPVCVCFVFVRVHADACERHVRCMCMRAQSQASVCSQQKHSFFFFFYIFLFLEKLLRKTKCLVRFPAQGSLTPASPKRSLRASSPFHPHLLLSSSTTTTTPPSRLLLSLSFL